MPQIFRLATFLLDEAENDARGRLKRLKRFGTFEETHANLYVAHQAKKRRRPPSRHRYQTSQAKTHPFLVKNHRRGPDVRFCHKIANPGLISKQMRSKASREEVGRPG